MYRYLLKRLLGLIPTLLIVAVLVFGFVHMLPGDPARLAAGPEAGAETIELVRKDLGLDLPLHQQFMSWGVSKNIDLVQMSDGFMPFKWMTVKK